MLRQVRETAPGLLVPLAWVFVAGAQQGLVSGRSIFIAHLVMAVFIGFFLVTGWADMSSGALAGWRAVMGVGFVVTVAGIGGFLVSPGTSTATALWAVSLFGWMLLPAVGLAYTGRLLDSAARIYYGSALLSGLGLLVAVGWILSGNDAVGLVGLALVGIGQTVGIVDAVVRF